MDTHSVNNNHYNIYIVQPKTNSLHYSFYCHYQSIVLFVFIKTFMKSLSLVHRGLSAGETYSSTW